MICRGVGPLAVRAVRLTGSLAQDGSGLRERFVQICDQVLTPITVEAPAAVERHKGLRPQALEQEDDAVAHGGVVQVV